MAKKDETDGWDDIFLHLDLHYQFTVLGTRNDECQYGYLFQSRTYSFKIDVKILANYYQEVI